MRTYRINSPQAAARIVGLAMLADGHLCKAELDVLDRHGAEGESIVLGAAVEHWGLHREMLQPELAKPGVEHV